MVVWACMDVQRHMTKTSTPITAEIFAEWKRKKAEAREAEQSAKRAERARTDRMRYVLWRERR